MSDETPTEDHSLGIDSEPVRQRAGGAARMALLASIATLIGIWVLAYVLWPHLPAKIPVHFDGSGRPDRWAARHFRIDKVHPDGRSARIVVGASREIKEGQTLRVTRADKAVAQVAVSRVSRDQGEVTVFLVNGDLMRGDLVATRWGTLLNWFALPLVTLFLTALMIAISLSLRSLARGWPGIMNIPRKKDFLKLPAEARVRALGPMNALLWATPAPLNAAFTYALWGSYCVAMEEWQTVPMWPLFAGIGGVLIVTLWGILALRSSITRELRAAEEHGEVAPSDATSSDDAPPPGDPESETPTKKMVDARKRRPLRRGTAFDVEKGSAPPGGGLYLPSPEELRPRSLDDFCGNERAVGQIRRELATGKFRDGPRNMLLYGPPGTGKTTLATIIAREAGYSVRELSGTSLRDQKSFMAFVLELSGADRRGENMLVFIDEIHAIAKQRAFNQEDLFLLLERGVVHCASYMGQTFRLRDGEAEVTEPTIKFERRPVFMGATTDPGMLNSAFRRRFPVHVKIEPYGPEDMETMLARYARISSHVITGGAKTALAGASRTNPANLLSMLDSCLNRAILSGSVERGTVTLDAGTVAEELDSLGVFPDGATRQDLRILEKLSRAPAAKDGRSLGMGLASLAGATGMNETTISEIIEPFLKAKGWIEVANRRKLTPEGLARLEAELEWPGEVVG
jgi:Holliday junction DNA helicase RuvB